MAGLDPVGCSVSQFGTAASPGPGQLRMGLPIRIREKQSAEHSEPEGNTIVTGWWKSSHSYTGSQILYLQGTVIFIFIFFHLEVGI